MGVQSALAKAGIAKQTARGTAATSATFGHGLTDGAILQVEVDQSIEEHTSGTRASGDVNRVAVNAGVELSARVHAKTVGLYAYAALGSVATTGAGPYTHACTIGDDLPYLTAFGKLANNFYSVQDVKIDELGFAWTGNEPLEMSVTGMGTALEVLGSDFTITSDETNAPYFTPVGGTFSIDVDGASGTAATAKINSGEVTIANNAEAIMVSGVITPDDVVVGRQEIEVSFEITPDNLNIWRTIVTGSASGTEASGTPVYGSFSCQFVSGSDTLTISANRVAFTCDFPDADPAGGTITLALAGLVVSANGASPLTVSVSNSQASY